MFNGTETTRTFRSLSRIVSEHAATDTHIGVAASVQLNSTHGSYITDRTSRIIYFCDATSGLLMEANKNDADFWRLLGGVGFPFSDKSMKALVDHARAVAKPVDVHRISWYDHQTSTAYVYSQGRDVYTVSSTGVRVIANGEENVYFLREDGAKPFSIVEGLSSKNLLELLFREIVTPTDGLITSDQSIYLLTIWFCCLCMGPLMAKLPALALVGSTGSNKTLLAKLLGLLLTGKQTTIVRTPHDRKSFDQEITSRGLLVMDDLTAPLPWLTERIESIISRETITMQSRQGAIPCCHQLECRLIITSRELHLGSLRKLSNLLVIELSPHVRTVLEGSLLHSVLTNRDEIMTGVLLLIQDILQAQNAAGADYTGSYQIADLANIVVRHARVHHPLGESFATNAFDRIAAVNEYAMRSPGQGLINALRLWVPDNQGRAVKPTELFVELEQIAARHGLDLAINSNRFGHVINRMFSKFEELFHVTKKKTAGRYHNFTFYLKDNSAGDE